MPLSVGCWPPLLGTAAAPGPATRVPSAPHPPCARLIGHFVSQAAPHLPVCWLAQPSRHATQGPPAQPNTPTAQASSVDGFVSFASSPSSLLSRLLLHPPSARSPLPHQALRRNLERTHLVRVGSERPPVEAGAAEPPTSTRPWPFTSPPCCSMPPLGRLNPT
ncbi:hypothetical protein PCL_03047 [Purpureocillium lilacinum]|uniref:Uncharacterized protein n=1 Tax=Purpureocillium lilacinum TaxID=33203 RepID=A0A2U3DYE5_PURLI|nr:hypothetical protein Purlil1_485 [Purpureocillium lilacinum]PWI67279.1 hypothetical protein PCL_03047 [Purpureocillium lilacinum]